MLATTAFSVLAATGWRCYVDSYGSKSLPLSTRFFALVILCLEFLLFEWILLCHSHVLKFILGFSTKIWYFVFSSK